METGFFFLNENRYSVLSSGFNVAHLLDKKLCMGQVMPLDTFFEVTMIAGRVVDVVCMEFNPEE